MIVIFDEKRTKFHTYKDMKSVVDEWEIPIELVRGSAKKVIKYGDLYIGHGTAVKSGRGGGTGNSFSLA